MAKRQATTILTHDNWDQEEEPEEAGTFKVAGDEELKTRVIKKARRKTLPGNSQSGKSPFAGFTGLLKSENQFKTPNFDFLKSIPPTPVLPGTNIDDRVANPPSSVNGNVNKNDETQNQNKENGEPGEEFLKQLKSLNESFFDWTKKHLDKHPHYILTPIFEDYGRHLIDIEQKFGVNFLKDFASFDSATTLPTASSKDVSNKPNVLNSVEPYTFSSTQITGFSSQKCLVKENPADASSTKFDSSYFSFNKPDAKASENSACASGFRFSGNENSSESFKFPTFQFGTSSKVATVPDNDDTSNKSQDDDNEVPKVKVTVVKESDSFYSQRCKMFYKKDENFVDRGIGNIHLKHLENSKVQLLFRAETNLGNILLNIALQKDIPIQKMGKNNVLIICVPNPPLFKDSKEPAKILFKVKSEKDADELCDMLLRNRS